MVKLSVRWRAWVRWLRHQDLIGAFFATLFVVAFVVVGFHAIVTLHGLRLAGG